MAPSTVAALVAAAQCATLVDGLTAHAAAATEAEDTPVTRVVGLLKGMAKTGKAEMEEDESLYKKLKCWCNNNDYAKAEAIEKSEAKIGDLKATIESLAGTTAELKATLKEVNEELDADKKALAEATSLREKQLGEFNNMEKDSIQAIENLKAAITVLAKHHDEGNDSSVAGGPVFKTEKDSWSFLQLGAAATKFPSEAERSFDKLMVDEDMLDSVDAGVPSSSAVVEAAAPAKPAPPAAAMLQSGSAWSPADVAVVQKAIVFAQARARNSEGYYPAYTPQSGEIFGVLKQLHEEMENDLSEAQKKEKDRAVDFEALRTAKTDEIKNGEQMQEEKEDQLANADNLRAEAKEDLKDEEASLDADKKFMKNLKETCSKADKDFEVRKDARVEELKAISETIDILQGDEARDAMASTFSFVQTSRTQSTSHLRKKAATALRRVAQRSSDPRLSLLVTSVQLDSFSKVKKAIDDMVGVLTQQQEDEVKKADYCKSELQDNEMDMEKGQTRQSDLDAKVTKLASDVKTLEDEIASAKAEIESSHVNLQRASMNRKQENLDFQKVMADQRITTAVLKKALNRLATYYDLVQTRPGQSFIQVQQTPPVPQMEFKKSGGATGVMEMIEKLIYDAKELMADSKTAEVDAQAEYEEMVSNTNAVVKALQKSVVTKTKAKGAAAKEMRATQSDLNSQMKELESLNKYNAELHEECDYILKNFDVRQQGRRTEIEGLQQAKQILNGADLA